MARVTDSARRANARDSLPAPVAYTPATSTAWTVWTVGRSAEGVVRNRPNSSNQCVPAEPPSSGSARARGSSMCRDARQHIATISAAKPGSPHRDGFP